MNKKAKRMMAQIMAFRKNRSLMKKMHDCFGIDFEKPFSIEPWEHALTENTIKKEYGEKELMLLLFTIADGDYHDLNIVPVIDGKFAPKYTSRNGYYPKFFTIGDFERARKAIGRERSPYEPLKHLEYRCYVLIPTATMPVRDQNQKDEEIRQLLNECYLRVKKYRTATSMSGKFMYCYDVKISGHHVGNDIHVGRIPDKSGYLSRIGDLKGKANEIRTRRSSCAANLRDWSIEVYAAEEGISALKRKVVETLDIVDDEFSWEDRNAYMDLNRDLFGIATKLNHLKKTIRDKKLASMENTELAFKEIMGTVKRHLAPQQEKVSENALVSV